MKVIAIRDIMLFSSLVFATTLIHAKSNITNTSLIHNALQAPPLSIDCAKVVTLDDNVLPSFEDALRDEYCGREFLRRVAPNGFVAVLGAHSYSEDSLDYKLIQTFSKKWTEKQSKPWPIAAGGNTGIMGAAIRGAKEGKGNGIILNVYFTENKGLINSHQPTDKYNFTYRDYNKRETDLLNYAQTIIIGAGSLGTIFEMIAEIENVYLGKKAELPIIVLTSTPTQNKITKLFSILMNNGLISNPKNRCKLINFTNSSDEALTLVMMEQPSREKHPSSGCNFLDPRLSRE